MVVPPVPDATSSPLSPTERAFPSQCDAMAVAVRFSTRYPWIGWIDRTNIPIWNFSFYISLWKTPWKVWKTLLV